MRGTPLPAAEPHPGGCGRGFGVTRVHFPDTHAALPGTGCAHGSHRGGGRFGFAGCPSPVDSPKDGPPGVAPFFTGFAPGGGAGFAASTGSASVDGQHPHGDE